MTLKDYQNDTLKFLRMYFAALGVKSPKEAYRDVTENADILLRLGKLRNYNESAGDVPVVTLKIPTGGGKTIVAAHAVKLIAEAQGREYPLVLWFAPSDTIRRQTAEALKKASHPYRQSLNEAFKGNVRVYDLDEVFTITPSDLAGNVCIVVATEQAFVREKDKTSKYRVYKHSESFEPHFASIHLEDGMDAQDDNASEPKFSFVNLAHHFRPIVIVDEAHQMVSELSKETLTRLNPSAILGLTATPDKDNNTLYSVMAKELFSEEMIKLPVELTEFSDDWHQAVLAAIAKRQELEKVANAEFASGEGGYLRPLLLLQASKKDGDVPIGMLKSFLTDTAKLPESEIAVVTGEQKELDGIDVTDPKCPIRYVITIQALKEGWDCPSAYVLCSVANIKSGTDTIQLLGRVMRQPNAKRRKSPQLNKAYAFVMSKTFGESSRELAEGLRKKGFDEAEAAAAIQVQTVLPLPVEEDEGGLFFKPDVVTLDSTAYEKIAADLPKGIEVAANPDGTGDIKVTADIPDEEVTKVVSVLSEKAGAAVAAEFVKKVNFKKKLAEEDIPAKKVKMAFPPLRAAVQGTFCWTGEDAMEVAGEAVEKYLPTVLSEGEFTIEQAGTTFYLKLDGNKITQQFVQSELEGFLKDMKSNLAAGDVVNELVALTKYYGIAPGAKRKWIAGIVNDLVAVRGFTPVQIYSFRFRLRDRLLRHIEEAAEKARKEAYQAVFMQEKYPVEVDVAKSVVLDGKVYAEDPLMKCYRGYYRFNKHFLGTHRIPAFDGQLKYGEGEEFDCAVQIDKHPKVATWLRSLDKCDESFWLPLAHTRFFPDFVGVLDDGRMFAIEYKGEHLRKADDTLEKDAVGRLWAAKSSGKCLYATVFKSEGGLDVKGQLDKLFGGAK